MTGVAAARGRATVAARMVGRDTERREFKTGEARGCGGRERRGEEQGVSGRSALRMHLWRGVNALVDTAVLEEVVARFSLSFRSCAPREGWPVCLLASALKAARPEDCHG